MILPVSSGSGTESGSSSNSKFFSTFSIRKRGDCVPTVPKYLLISYPSQLRSSQHLRLRRVLTVLLAAMTCSRGDPLKAGSELPNTTPLAAGPGGPRLASPRIANRRPGCHAPADGTGRPASNFGPLLLTADQAGPGTVPDAQP